MLRKIGAAVLAIALMLVMASCGSKAPGTSNTPDTSSTPNTSGTPDTLTPSQEESGSVSTPAASGNSLYNAVFDDTTIVHSRSFFNMEMSCFAMKTEEGRIYCADYGYKDDVVRQWVETVYIPISECTDSEVSEIMSDMYAQTEKYRGHSCCSTEYTTTMNYYIVELTFSDVDKAENYSELYNAGMLSDNTFISMSQTEEGLLEQGYVKK